MSYLYRTYVIGEPCHHGMPPVLCRDCRHEREVKDLEFKLEAERQRCDEISAENRKMANKINQQERYLEEYEKERTEYFEENRRLREALEAYQEQAAFKRRVSGTLGHLKDAFRLGKKALNATGGRDNE